MDKITRFIECLVPVSACNLRCEYCYIIQENRRKDEIPKFKYSPEHIGKALSKERLGGTSYISICGAGETLIPKEMPDIIEEILKQGHYVNITTNGTLTNRFEEILKISPDLLKHLQFAFSFHYLELKRLNLLDTFFNNINAVKNAGCSFLVQLNLYDQYIPYLDEIKRICKEKTGAYPQVAVTRIEERKNYKNTFRLHTSLGAKKYKEIGDTFNSKLFDFTMKNFNVKRNEFCYAGDWSFILNLATGNIRTCYAELENQNIFEDISKPIKFRAIGKNCNSEYCINSSHFMSLGIVPSIDTPSYAELRNREEAGWYNNEMKEFLNTKFIQTHKEYNKLKKFQANYSYPMNRVVNKIKSKIRMKLKNE